MAGRIHDWLHERYIGRLKRSLALSMRSGDRVMVRAYWTLLIVAIKSRSPAQMDRMEYRAVSRMDESSRRIFEQHRVSRGGI